ncbi:MAG: phosphoglycerate kinase [Candidatus Daviesbacteria bacterium]|nr:phosphoglycerate kinase [Candidatus Daviesbacteria bacterium]
MQVVTPELIKDKKVLLRMDLDVPLVESSGKSQESRIVVADDFRLKAGLPTLKLCLESAEEVIIMGHIGRPQGFDPELSVEPIYDWLEKQGLCSHLTSGKLKILENLRFEAGESFDTAQDETAVSDYAKELAKLGDPSTTSTALSTSSLRTSVFVNEAFASYHPSASTTVLPTLLPHFAGLRFMEEVEVLTRVRNNPKHPFVAIIGGAKVDDKLPVVEALSKIADYVLVGGKLVSELAGPVAQQPHPTSSTSTALSVRALDGAPRFAPPANLPDNVLIGELNEAGTDVTHETIEKWKPIIQKAKMIVWNGPMGKIEEPKNFQTHELANIIIQTEAETIVGGGDTIGYLGKLGLLERFSFVSTGGGAMLKFLETGTLPTIEVLK